MTIVTKATEGDKRSALSDANADGWVVDYDDSFAYIEVWVGGPSRYQTSKVPYTYNGVTATMDTDSATLVVRQTDYIDVVDDDAPVTKGMIMGLLEKHFGSTKSEPKLPHIKSLDIEEMISIEQLYISAGDEDGHGETYDTAVMKSMVENFNTALDDSLIASSFFHKQDTTAFTIGKAWTVDEDTLVGETLVKANTPLVSLQWTNEKAWEKRKSGELMGVSIKAIFTYEED